MLSLFLALAVVSACGDDAPPSTSPSKDIVSWRILERRSGETGFTLTFGAPCRVRFRVPGAETAHT
ncbi:MAG: hypothetical protein QNJ90_07310 [Planctomycetota bacterium]|nr:hypothetical protein [Planctomycetota bacterium]